MPMPRKAPHLKSISGSREPIPPHVELPTLTDVPDPPDWLANAHATKEWKRLAPILVANKLLTEPGLAAFGHMCSLHGKLVQLWSAGESPTGHMLAQYRNLINDFGLTPVAQGKVKNLGTEDKGNPFSKFGKQAAPAA